MKKRIGTLITLAAVLCAVHGVAEAASISGKGTLEAWLLKVHSTSDFEIKANLKDDGGAQIVEFTVDKRDSLKSGFDANTAAAILPSPTLIKLLEHIDVAKLKSDIRLQLPVSKDLTLDVVFKDDKDGVIRTDVSGVGLALQGVILPRLYLLVPTAIPFTGKVEISGSLAYDANGGLTGGKLNYKFSIGEMNPKPKGPATPPGGINPNPNPPATNPPATNPDRTRVPDRPAPKGTDEPKRSPPGGAIGLQNSLLAMAVPLGAFEDTDKPKPPADNPPPPKSPPDQPTAPEGPAVAPASPPATPGPSEPAPKPEEKPQPPPAPPPPAAAPRQPIPEPPNPLAAFDFAYTLKAEYTLSTQNLTPKFPEPPAAIPPVTPPGNPPPGQPPQPPAPPSPSPAPNPPPNPPSPSPPPPTPPSPVPPPNPPNPPTPTPPSPNPPPPTPPKSLLHLP